jgi:hypothetical protein
MGSHEDAGLSSSGTQSNSTSFASASSPTYSREQKTDSLVEQRNSTRTKEEQVPNGACYLAAPANVELHQTTSLPQADAPEQLSRCQSQSRSLDNLCEYIGSSATSAVDELQFQERSYVNTSSHNTTSNQCDLYSYARTPDLMLLPPHSPLRSTTENTGINTGDVHRTGSYPNHLDVDRRDPTDVTCDVKMFSVSSICQEIASQSSVAPTEHNPVGSQISDSVVETNVPGIKMSTRSRVFSRQKSSVASANFLSPSSK